MIPFRPLFNRIVIELEEKSETGKIIIPNPVDRGLVALRIGRIVRVGPGLPLHSGKHLDCVVKVGQRVAILLAGAQEIRVEGKTYFMAKEEAVYGVFDEELNPNEKRDTDSNCEEDSPVGERETVGESGGEETRAESTESAGNDE